MQASGFKGADFSGGDRLFLPDACKEGKNAEHEKKNGNNFFKIFFHKQLTSGFYGRKSRAWLVMEVHPGGISWLNRLDVLYV